MSWRTLKTKYRGSIIGIFWSLSNPILMTATYAAIFGTAFASYYQGSVWRYVVATFVGLTILNIFSQTSSQALASIVSSGGILNKLKFCPRSLWRLQRRASHYLRVRSTCTSEISHTYTKSFSSSSGSRARSSIQPHSCR
jgi:hypothetical protein